MGLRDYVNKNGFPGVVLGLSGGIDSAVTAAMAVDALGAERVHCVMLPYRYTSNDSLSDAAEIAETLGVRYDIVPIEQPVEGFAQALAPMFAGREPDITEENLQSRDPRHHPHGRLQQVRRHGGDHRQQVGDVGRLRHALRRHERRLQSGEGPLQDRGLRSRPLAQRAQAGRCAGAGRPRHSGKRHHPRRPRPSCAPDQTDQDSLPAYDALDDILECLVEDEMRVAEVVARGHDLETVRKVERLLYIAEYKRRQAAPGVKITRKNFGRDRRYPITNKFRDKG